MRNYYSFDVPHLSQDLFHSPMHGFPPLCDSCSILRDFAHPPPLRLKHRDQLLHWQSTWKRSHGLVLCYTNIFLTLLYIIFLWKLGKNCLKNENFKTKLDLSIWNSNFQTKYFWNFGRSFFRHQQHSKLNCC